LLLLKSLSDTQIPCSKPLAVATLLKWSKKRLDYRNIEN
jgi:hypothetical protein